MKPSDEIRSVVKRWIAATAARDANSVMGRMSDNPGALSVGTDPEEWWHGEEALAIWRRQFEEAGPYRFEPGPVEAWEEGTVGRRASRSTSAGRVVMRG
jgi:hypothetical protein